MTITTLVAVLQRINAADEEVHIAALEGELSPINEVRVTFDADGLVESVVLW